MTEAFARKYGLWALIAGASEGIGASLADQLAARGLVDVCCTPLGMTYTPAFARMGIEYDPQSHMLPDDVAREIIENIGNGPVHVVGENNRAVASQVWTIDRRSLVEMMSAASIDFATRREA